jgi:hypothetical protein
MFYIKLFYICPNNNVWVDKLNKNNNNLKKFVIFGARLSVKDEAM